MGCFQSKDKAAGEGKAPAPEKVVKTEGEAPAVEAPAATGANGHVAAEVPKEDEKRASVKSDDVDVLAPVKEAERKAAEKELTEEEKADEEAQKEVDEKVAALNEDPESEKAYKRESLKSEAEIGFVTVSENDEPKKKDSGVSMPVASDEAEIKKNSVEEPIIPEGSNDPDQVLVGGAGSD